MSILILWLLTVLYKRSIRRDVKEHTENVMWQLALMPGSNVDVKLNVSSESAYMN